MRADNSHHLVAAARRRSQATRGRAIQALRRLVATGDPVTFDSVARTADVSRSWLYAQPDLRIEIGRLRAQQQRRRQAPNSPPVPPCQHASDASLRRRLEVTTAEIRRLRDENHQLREQLAWALGERRAAGVHRASEHERAPDPSRASTIGPCS
jgi:Family of unknown function (DUF6262)